MTSKRKPTCVKGTACGYACISGKKQCSERIKARDTAELLKSTGVTGQKPVKEGVDVDKIPVFTESYGGFYQMTDVDVPPDTVNIEIAPLDGASLELSFRVNGDYNAGTASKGNEVKVAMVAMRHFKDEIKYMPDGLILRNTPFKDDDKYDSRVKLYKKAGFSDVDEETGEQYGIVYKDKIYPLSNFQFYDRMQSHPGYGGY